MAAPVVSHDAFAGVAGADLGLGAISTMLANLDVGGEGYAFLIEESGRILVNPDQARIPHNLTEVFPAAAARLSGNAVLGSDEHTIYGLFPITGLPGAKWYVGIALDRQAMLQPLASFRTSAIVAAAVAVLLIVPLLGLLIHRLVASPIVRMTAVMKQLADGNTEVAIPEQDRRDEIGEMANAVQVFKANMLQDRQARRRTGGRAHGEGSAHRPCGNPRAGIRGEGDAACRHSVVRRNRRAADDPAQSMSGIAGQTGQRITAVIAVAEELGVRVSTATSAGEELSSSISEISRQGAQVASVANEAVDGGRAHRTDDAGRWRVARRRSARSSV